MIFMEYVNLRKKEAANGKEWGYPVGGFKADELGGHPLGVLLTTWRLIVNNLRSQLGNAIAFHAEDSPVVKLFGP